MKRFLVLTALFSIFQCVGSFQKKGRFVSLSLVPEATRVGKNGFESLGLVSGESSAFFLFGLFPVTPPPSLDIALSHALEQKEGAQSLVQLQIQEETHTYFPLGSVSLVRVQAQAIRYKDLP